MTSLMRGQLLGKHFRHHGKMPIGINVFNKDFKQRLLTLCSTTFGRMAGTGPLFSMQFTTVTQSVEHGLDNLRTVCQTIGKDLPGGWSNVDHAYFYGNNLQSLPIYYSQTAKNDVKKLNKPSNDRNRLTQLGELSTMEKNINVIVEPNGNVHLTKRKQLKDGYQKKKPTKRLVKTWTKGLASQSTGTILKKKPTKGKKIKVDDTPVFNIEGKALVDTAFVQRVTETKLAKKNAKPKHVEQTFASKPAPRAEKRKRLLAAAKQSTKENNDEVPTLVEVDEERKIKSGGRSKKKVRVNA